MTPDHRGEISASAQRFRPADGACRTARADHAGRARSAAEESARLTAPASGQHEVVAVDELGFADEAEQPRDLR